MKLFDTNSTLLVHHDSVSMVRGRYNR